MNNHFVISCLSALAQASVLVVLAWPLVPGARRLSAARFSTVCRLVMAGAVVVALSDFVRNVRGAADEAGASRGMVSGGVNRLPEAGGDAVEALWRVEGNEETFLSSPPGVARASGVFRAFSLWWTVEPALARTLFGLWLAGAGVVVLTWWHDRRARAALRRRSRVVADDDPLATAARGYEGLPPCRLWVHDGPVAPCVWGLWSPVLLLPAAVRAWPAARLRMIFAHEGAHLRRRDPWWRFLADVFLAAFWFHPLAWGLARHARQADERAADDTVLAREPDAPGYAETLLECARRFTMPAPPRRAAFPMAGRGALPARVRAVLDPQRDRRSADGSTWLAGLLLLAAMAGLAALATPRLVAETAVVATDENDAGNETDRTSQEDDSGEKESRSAWTPIEIKGRDYLRASEVGAFYKFASVDVDPAGDLVFRSPRLAMRWKKSPPAELRINGVKFRTRHVLEHHEGEWMISRDDLVRMLDPVLRPQHIKNAGPLKTIILDPGHGGRDSGATGAGGSEAVFCLDVAQRLQPLLEEAGFTVRLTREDDRFVSLGDRAAAAEGVTDGVVVSLHFNSSRSAGDRGVQTCFPAAGLGNEEHLGAAVALATAVHASCLQQTKAPDAGVMAAEFSLMRRLSHLPVIFINGGNLGFDDEAATIATDAYRERLAVAIADGVKSYRHAVGRTRK